MTIAASGISSSTNPGPAAPPADASALATQREMQARNSKARPLELLPDVHPRRIPRHVAIIMDGNGRWATRRGFPRIIGHRHGAEVAKDIIEQCTDLGVEVVTLYSFSLENWKRPADEIDAIMEIYGQYIVSQRPKMMADGLRFRQIGRRDGLPAPVLKMVDETEALTRANSAATLCLAVNYGSRAEITDAVRALARRVERGELKPEQIDEAAIGRELYTGGLPDPDLLIRTGGEMRVSNYLLWQISYAELYVTDVLWPDFGAANLHAAIRDYAKRSRRFGGLDEAEPV